MPHINYARGETRAKIRRWRSWSWVSGTALKREFKWNASKRMRAMERAVLHRVLHEAPFRGHPASAAVFPRKREAEDWWNYD